MSKNRVKLLLGVGALAGGLLIVLLAVVLLGRVVLRFGSGADFATALNVVPEAPSDMAERLEWLPDATPAEMRPLPPYVRAQIGGAYLNAWAQLAVSHELGEPLGMRTYWGEPALAAATRAVTETAAAGWEVSQSDLRHALQLRFFSDDGAIVALTDHDAHVVRHLRAPMQQVEEVFESSSRYDVIMQLEDGNWRIRYLVRRGEGTRAVTPPFTRSAPVAVRADGFVRTHGTAELSFAPAGVNYYPQATPWTRFWREYDSAQTATDFAQAAALDLNMVRIFVPFDDFGGADVDPQMLGRLLDLMDRAEEAGLLVLVTLFDHRTDHHPVNWAADDRHIAGVVPAVARHAALFGWDIKNEPDRDYAASSPVLVDAWLRHVAAEVRRHDPVHPLTIGWSTIAAAHNLIDVVDFVSYHFYGDPAAYAPEVAALQTAAGAKPLLLQEFGMSTWNTILPGGHTEHEQAAFYADVLSQNEHLGVAGHVAWTLFDFSDIPLTEFARPWARGVQARFGLIRADGTHKPAAALVGRAAARLAPPVPLTDRLRKPFNLGLAAAAVVCVCGFFVLRRRH